jgi:DNA (cytosine-5)-methyltransferase 1
MMKSLNLKVDKPTTIQCLGDDNLLTFNMKQAAKYFDVNPHTIEPRLRKLNMTS